MRIFSVTMLGKSITKAMFLKAWTKVTLNWQVLTILLKCQWILYVQIQSDYLPPFHSLVCTWYVSSSFHRVCIILKNMWNIDQKHMLKMVYKKSWAAENKFKLIPRLREKIEHIQKGHEDTRMTYKFNP